MNDSNFQGRGTEHGTMFESICRSILAHAGFEVGDKVTIGQLGIEIDAVLHNQRGCAFFCEMKGSWMGNRPGCRRTDTVKKALCSAYSCHAEGGFPPFLVITSHAPAPDLAADTMVKAARRHGVLFDLINISDPRDVQRLERIAQLDGEPTEWPGAEEEDEAESVG